MSRYTSRCITVLSLSACLVATTAVADACSLQDTATLKNFGCSPAQIAKRCSATARTRVALAELKPQTMPAQGLLTVGGNRIAPFRVHTPAEGGHYYLKLVDAANPKHSVLTFFMRPNSVFETKVPLGSYKLRYASGTEWFGARHLFGPCRSSFFEAQAVLNFARTGNRLSGHEIKLIKQVGGNLETRNVDEDDF